MKIKRRDFFKAAARATGLIMLQPAIPALAAQHQTSAGLAMLIDITKCISCWWCYAACKDYNNLPETRKPELAEPPELSPTVWTTLHTVQTGTQWVSRKAACNHCTEAACADICPTGALSYNDLGYVQYDPEKCSGCGYCAEVCPFGVPRLEQNSITGVAIMNKCTFCHDRVSNGESTACAAACPTGAITLGDRSVLVSAAVERMAELTISNPKAGLYGVEELGGLHVIYILDDSPEVYGLPPDPGIPAAVSVRNALGWAGSIGAIAAMAGFGINYLIARKRMARRAK